MTATRATKTVHDKPDTKPNGQPSSSANKYNTTHNQESLCVFIYLGLGLLCTGLLEGGLDEASDAFLVDAGERIKVQ